MATYKCFSCGKAIKPEYVKKKIRCPYCGYKILYKSRTISVKVKAR
jgi:DNA-directed RNA polymerase subunit RPC12/RpoP